MLLLVVAGISLGVAVVFLVFSIYKFTNQESYDTWAVGVVLAIIAILGVIGGFGGGIASQHSEALYMPIRLASLNLTIEQQTEYIVGIDVTVGQGLEGVEVKREIQQTIRDRNELIAQMEYRTISPWYLFKPDMGDK